MRMRSGNLRGALSPHATQRQMDILAAYVAAGGSVQDASVLVCIRPSAVKRHPAEGSLTPSLAATGSAHRGLDKRAAGDYISRHDISSNAR